MSATMDNSTDWQREVLRLKHGPRQMPTSEIAKVVDKHAATVRKVVARATDEEVEAALAAEQFSANGAAIPGQTTVDDHLADVPPEDDPEHPDALAEFRAQAGEAVGPMPKDPEPDPLGYEVRVRGTRQQCIDFGPEADIPTGGVLVLKSEKVASGHYSLGDVIQGTFFARITDVGGKERFDKASEEYRAKPVAYVATITEFSLAVEDEG